MHPDEVKSSNNASNKNFTVKKKKKKKRKLKRHLKPHLKPLKVK